MTYPLSWLREAPSAARKTLVAAMLGWMLDGMDVMLYSMVLAHLMQDLQLSTQAAGLLASITLLSSAFGGLVFGILADRAGRTRALMASILVYSVFTAACGLATTLTQLAVFRIFLGLGMGGEWATGAALVSETWPSENRGKAFGFMQSGWAIGYALAAGITAVVLPVWGWRAVFFAGIAPALVTFWIRKSIPEPEVWQQARQTQEASRRRSGFDLFSELFEPPLVKPVMTALIVNAATMFGWWGLFSWIPGYLALPAEKGGAGLDIMKTSEWVILMQAGMWLGYVSFGYVSDQFGRKRSYITYLFIAAALVPLYGATRDPLLLLCLGPLVAFFGTGYFVGFGVLTAELFPTHIRATAQGFTYNAGRAVSAIAPFTVGTLALTKGLGFAFQTVAIAFLAAGLLAFLLPETKGREIRND